MSLGAEAPRAPEQEEVKKEQNKRADDAQQRDKEDVRDQFQKMETGLMKNEEGKRQEKEQRDADRLAKLQDAVRANDTAFQSILRANEQQQRNSERGPFRYPKPTTIVIEKGKEKGDEPQYNISAKFTINGKDAKLGLHSFQLSADAPLAEFEKEYEKAIGEIRAYRGGLADPIRNALGYYERKTGEKVETRTEPPAAEQQREEVPSRPSVAVRAGGVVVSGLARIRGWFSRK